MPYDETYVAGMNDHVLVAILGGTGQTACKMGAKSLSAPLRPGVVTVAPRGQGGLWRVEGVTESTCILLGHERLLAAAEQMGDGRPTELLHRLNVQDAKLHRI